MSTLLAGIKPRPVEWGLKKYSETKDRWLWVRPIVKFASYQDGDLAAKERSAWAGEYKVMPHYIGFPWKD